MEKHLKFNKINPTQLTKYSYKEYNTKEEYVKYGDDNLFPQQLVNLYNKSSIHAACINAITEAIIGQGLTCNIETYLNKANSRGESWNDIFAKAALDYKLYGTFALEIIYSNDRSKIEVYHIDYGLLRAKEKDYRGRIPGYYISTEWKKYTRFTKGIEDRDIYYLPVFDPSKKWEESNQIYVKKSYRPGQEYYPLPDYVGALRVIETDTEIDNFHCSNLKNGLTPSLMITTFTNGSDSENQAVLESLKGEYAGTDNAGTIMYIDVPSKEQAPIVTPIGSTATDTYYTTINDTIIQKILTAHRITSPMLLGIKTEGQLGGRTEIIDAHSLFMTMVIEPLQQDLLKCFNMLFEYNYPDAVLGVENTKLFPDGEDTTEIIVDADTTEQEESEIITPETLG